VRQREETGSSKFYYAIRGEGKCFSSIEGRGSAGWRSGQCREKEITEHPDGEKGGGIGGGEVGYAVNSSSDRETCVGGGKRAKSIFRKERTSPLGGKRLMMNPKGGSSLLGQGRKSLYRKAAVLVEEGRSRKKKNSVLQQRGRGKKKKRSSRRRNRKREKGMSSVRGEKKTSWTRGRVGSDFWAGAGTALRSGAAGGVQGIGENENASLVLLEKTLIAKGGGRSGSLKKSRHYPSEKKGGPGVACKKGERNRVTLMSRKLSPDEKKGGEGPRSKGRGGSSPQHRQKDLTVSRKKKRARRAKKKESAVVNRVTDVIARGGKRPNEGTSDASWREEGRNR